MCTTYRLEIHALTDCADHDVTIASQIANKRQDPYSSTLFWLRCKPKLFLNYSYVPPIPPCALEGPSRHVFVFVYFFSFPHKSSFIENMKFARHEETFTCNNVLYASSLQWFLSMIAMHNTKKSNSYHLNIVAVGLFFFFHVQRNPFTLRLSFRLT